MYHMHTYDTYCYDAYIILYSKDSRQTRLLSWFEATFKRVCGDDNLMTMEQFENALHIKGVCKTTQYRTDYNNIVDCAMIVVPRKAVPAHG